MKTQINKIIIHYLLQYNPSRISVFGSYARNDDTKESDIDILIDFKHNVTLFDLGGIKHDLSELLNRKVDIVTESSLNKRIRPYIEKDLQIIYE